MRNRQQQAQWGAEGDKHVAGAKIIVAEQSVNMSLWHLTPSKHGSGRWSIRDELDLGLLPVEGKWESIFFLVQPSWCLLRSDSRRYG